MYNNYAVFSAGNIFNQTSKSAISSEVRRATERHLFVIAVLQSVTKFSNFWHLYMYKICGAA